MEEKLFLTPEPNENVNYLRILIAGEPNTGKSTFLNNNAHPQNIFFFKINRVNQISSREQIHGALVFMDVSQQNGLVKALEWVQEITERVPYSLPILLVVNKIDLVNRVSSKVIDSFIKEWICCSSLKNNNVKEVTQTIQKMVMLRIKLEMFNALQPEPPEPSILEKLFDLLI